MTGLTYLKTEELKERENYFKPLEGEDFNCLVESIRECGILHPLVVRKDEDGTYTILAGHNRWRAAKKLGLEVVPCNVVDPHDPNAEMIQVGAMFDTNLFKRELNRAEKKQYIELREKKKREQTIESIKEKLLPEIVEMFTGGIIDYATAKALSAISHEVQKELFKRASELFPEESHDYDIEIEELKHEKERAEKKVAELEAQLNEKEAKVKEMKQQMANIQKRVQERLEKLEIESAKKGVDEALRQEYEKDLEELRKNLEDMSRTVQQKDQEIERIREEKASVERESRAKAAEVKAMMLKLQQYEAHIKKVINPELIIKKLDGILKEIDAIKEITKSPGFDITAEIRNQGKERLTAIQKEITNLLALLGGDK